MNNKEEILARSRSENKEKDLFEREIQIKAGNIGAFTATILATIFFVTQIIAGSGFNYGIYAIIFSITSTGYIVRSIYLKRKSDIVYAIIYTAVVIMFTSAHIYTLITTSTIM